MRFTITATTLFLILSSKPTMGFEIAEELRRRGQREQAVKRPQVFSLQNTEHKFVNPEGPVTPLQVPPNLKPDQSLLNELLIQMDKIEKAR